ncbi:J domain-containing protein [Amorphus orientalis]|uniref:Curved DNA-binding protein CbpA n=1 Tax=Amorphus orientalis TaxID=649198 RepID=A0AAE3VKI2_9HYPH|nr:J domain-containing protein [Amorphus orientalis]MDQ0313819.1 curved DNA-binding protein CbpA [Amorphus orientalis]
MKLDSKHFDRIRIKRASDEPAPEAPTCAHKGCTARGLYRAPMGRGREGQYLLLCLDHVRAYNKTYNYFDGMSDEAVQAFQKDAIVGHRPTRKVGVNSWAEKRGQAADSKPQTAWSGLYEDPFGLFGEDGAKPAPDSDNRPRRRALGPERRALETLGLEESASRDDIKSRYKTLVKRHHPDANHGDRGSEERLRRIIQAYTVLRRAGYC